MRVRSGGQQVDMLARGSPVHLASLDGLSATLRLSEGESTEGLKQHGLELLVRMLEEVDEPLS
eukprot:13509478-Alexandrium_andersonii.AAC.1